MERKLFRSKSIDRISSPEQLSDYVRVSNPGVWMALTAIIVLLLGVCVWGIFGKMDTTIPAAAIVKNGQALCYVKEEDADGIEIGQPISINGNEYTVSFISSSPVLILDDADSYIMHLGSLSVGDWVIEVAFSAALPDGIYECKIVTQSLSPVSFLLN